MFTPEGGLSPDYRYFVAYGGRGSGKSEGVAQLLVMLSYTEANIKILCARHIQHSIAESSKSRIEEWIRRLGWEDVYHITKVDITNKRSGSKFIFKGLSSVTKENITSINDIKYLWIEEAHSITQEVWLRTDPSVRAPDSRIFITFNPHQASDIMYQLFVQGEHPRAWVRKVNYPDNPWFVETPLYQQRLDFKATYPDAIYRHVWEGDLITYNEAPVIYPDRFKTWTVLPPLTQLIIAVDTAYTVKTSSDYTAMGAFARHQDNYYLLDVFRGKWEFDALYQHLVGYCQDITRRHGRVHAVLIEGKASGITLLQLLRRHTKLPIREWQPTKDKYTRVCEVLDVLHSTYHVPHERAGWQEAYLEELRFFTSNDSHEHDDQVDITTMALSHLRGTLTSSSFINILGG